MNVLELVNVNLVSRHLTFIYMKFWKLVFLNSQIQLLYCKLLYCKVCRCETHNLQYLWQFTPTEGMQNVQFDTWSRLPGFVDLIGRVVNSHSYNIQGIERTVQHMAWWFCLNQTTLICDTSNKIDQWLLKTIVEHFW